MTPYTKYQELALLLLRVVVATIFLNATVAKLPFWTTPPEGMPTSMVLLTRFLSIVEPIGGIAVLVGLLTRFAAAGLAIIMAGSLFFIRILMHATLFTGLQGPGMDYNLLILVGCIVLIAFGAGSWSVDAMRKRA